MIKERESEDEERKESDALIDALEPEDAEEMEEAKEMMKRIQGKWENKKEDLKWQIDELLDTLVILGKVYYNECLYM